MPDNMPETKPTFAPVNETGVKSFYLKPLPMESVHKHVAMLVNYLEAASKDDPVKTRKGALRRVSFGLQTLLKSRAMKQLLDYGNNYYWLSCNKFTVLVVTNSNLIIADTAPVVRKFIGQHLRNLIKWSGGLGGLQIVQL